MSARANKVATHKKVPRKIAGLGDVLRGADVGENVFQMADGLGDERERIGRAARLAGEVGNAGCADAASAREMKESIDFIGFPEFCLAVDAVCAGRSIDQDASGSSASSAATERAAMGGGGVAFGRPDTESDASERTRSFGEGVSTLSRSPLPVSAFDDSTAFPVPISEKSALPPSLDAWLAEKTGDITLHGTLA